ncbi:group I truncated hemoglobin [Candidatus Uabimicrobium amorphum]|uniref:Group 1 truncated hemoglobin n=1 Tax=Uabimicrobium amorphum TaxID=2596890 RepID=A0A5S9F340_UABAM|nr:group 1 truncated hemoglobin [Candidatus Uabimicrobium amorphum]BBM84276.1 group 1 truncated hemoglobin [Candidatus Uabimicrobium amorphum]
MKYLGFILIVNLLFVGCCGCGSKDKENEKQEIQQVEQEQETKQEKTEEAPKESLYNRIGGDPVVDKAVRLFYDKLLQDEEISVFFGNTNLEENIQKQKAFFNMIFGGPSIEYTEEQLRQVHRPLIQMGLNAIHFERFVTLMIESLVLSGVNQEEANEIRDICNSYQDVILDKKNR